MDSRRGSLILGAVLVVLSSVEPASGSSDAQDRFLVNAPVGPVRGVNEVTRTGKNVTSFLGIRFAKPPVGDLRFKPPVPADPWTEVFDASKPPETCFQKVIRAARFIPTFKKLLPSTSMSEDCLKLNVWVPEPRPVQGHVVVSIHGGGFTQGSVTVPVINGATLAGEENLIVVAFNYRVASLGFLYLDHPDVPGNAGLYDQKLALDWVRDNIASFGGDASKVTLTGQSAGAASAALHAMSGLSDDTFSRIAVMSPPVIPWTILERNVSFSKGVALAKNAGCPSEVGNLSATVDCLKKLDPSDLIDNEPTREYNTMVFKPIVDGKIVPRMPEDSWERGKFKLTDLLVGSNRDEGTVFLTLMSPYIFQVLKQEANPSQQDYYEILHDFFRDDKIAKIVQYEYSHWTGLSNSKKVFRDLEKTVNDYFFTCTTNRMAKAYADRGQHVHKYFFVHPAPSSQAPDWFGAFHGVELHYLFGDVFDFKPTLSKSEINFGHRMMRYLGNFVRTGNPNQREDGTVEEIFWPPHTPNDREYLVLAPNSTAVGHKLHEKHCQFWDKYFPFISKQIGYRIVHE